MRLRSLFLPAIAFLAVLMAPIVESGAGVATPPSPHTGLPVSPDFHQIQISSCTWFQREVWAPARSIAGASPGPFAPTSEAAIPPAGDASVCGNGRWASAKRDMQRLGSVPHVPNGAEP
jgi:hypothetical protein